MGYLKLYLYPIQRRHRDEFLEIMREVRDIYQKHGAYGEELFLLHERTSKYGVTGLWEILPTKEDEEIWIGLDRYRDAEHSKEVMKAVDADPEINPLYEGILQLVNSPSRIVRGEFEEVGY